MISDDRTKWKRQTAVGLELLAEAGNYAAVQRMLQANPYWAAYDPHAASLVSNMDTILLRHAAGSLQQTTTAATSNGGSDPLLPRMFLQGLQQHVTRIPPHQVFTNDAHRLTTLV